MSGMILIISFNPKEIQWIDYYNLFFESFINLQFLQELSDEKIKKRKVKRDYTDAHIYNLNHSVDI